jgi:hypothetical protein
VAGVDDEDEELADADVDPPLSLLFDSLFDSLFGDAGALSLADGFPFCE